jgi:hypothetical protein
MSSFSFAATSLNSTLVDKACAMTVTVRFLSVDPARQFHSGYRYGTNSPLNGVDPDGEEWYYLDGQWQHIENTPTLEVSKYIHDENGDFVRTETQTLVGIDMEFEGYTHPRYSLHDVAILEATRLINNDMAHFVGATEHQAAEIPYLDPRLVKSQMIQETGGGDRQSRDAWAADPLQANVPGQDWTDRKIPLGLCKPICRNEGFAEINIRAGIIFMIRKGFGRAGQAPANRPAGFFDGYAKALERYNGRSLLVASGLKYREEYSQRIIQRAKQRHRHVPIEIKK